LLADGDDSDTCGFGAEFALQAKAEFLTEITVELTEESAELDAVKAIVQADVGGAVTEFVVFDVVDKEAGDFGAAAAEGLRSEDASITVFAGHGFGGFTI
jgi:hypothetical protein